MAVRRPAVLAPPRKARAIAIAPATDVATARRAVLREALNQVLDNVPGTLVAQDAEYLHQLRVGSRRLRAGLFVFEDTLRHGEARALTRMLRTLSEAAGPARDWDVFKRRLSPALRPAAERRRRAAYVQLRRVLRAPQLWLLPRGRPAAQQPLAAFARAALERADRKVLGKGARINWAKAGKRHALRVRLRRLRYACEFLRGAFPERDAEPLISSLRHLQDVLGDLNDIEVARRLREALGAPAPRSTRKEKLIASLPAAWKAFAAAPRFFRDRPQLASKLG